MQAPTSQGVKECQGATVLWLWDCCGCMFVVTSHWMLGLVGVGLALDDGRLDVDAKNGNERSAAAGEQDRASAATGVWDRADSSGSSRCTPYTMHSLTPFHR
jgi:hypothetical protein